MHITTTVISCTRHLYQRKKLCFINLNGKAIKIYIFEESLHEQQQQQQKTKKNKQKKDFQGNY